MRPYQLVLFPLLASMAWFTNASAACDQPMLEKLLAQGFSKEQIMQLCGQPGAAPPAAAQPPAAPTPFAGQQPTAPGAPAVPPNAAQVEEARYPTDLVGSWEGMMGASSVRLVLAGNGQYRLFFTMVSGSGGIQVGTWFVEGPMFMMTPQQPVPGFTENHPYELDATKTTLTISGAQGVTRLIKAK